MASAVIEAVRECLQNGYENEYYTNENSHHSIINSEVFKEEIDNVEFIGKSDMHRHAKEVHGLEEKAHKCDKCYKSFPSSQQLTQHLLVHNNIRKYSCQFCDKMFKQLSHVQQHQRRHTGERPYRCNIEGCEKAFAQLSNLQQHQRNHEGSRLGAERKPFPCTICDRRFATEVSLDNHVTKVHNPAISRPMTLPHIPMSSATLSQPCTSTMSLPSITLQNSSSNLLDNTANIARNALDNRGPYNPRLSVLGAMSAGRLGDLKSLESEIRNAIQRGELPLLTPEMELQFLREISSLAIAHEMALTENAAHIAVACRQALEKEKNVEEPTIKPKEEVSTYTDKKENGEDVSQNFTTLVSKADLNLLPQLAKEKLPGYSNHQSLAEMEAHRKLAELSKKDLNLLRAARGNIYDFPSQVPVSMADMYMKRSHEFQRGRELDDTRRGINVLENQPSHLYQDKSINGLNQHLHG